MTSEPWVPCVITFISTLDIHMKDISDITKWHHCHLLLHLGGKKPLDLHSQVEQTHLHTCQHPRPISHTLLHTNCYISFVPQFLHLLNSPQGILVHPCTKACNLFQKVTINIPKWCTKIGEINTYNKIDGYNMDGMEINELNWWLNAWHYKNIMLSWYMNNMDDCYCKWQILWYDWIWLKITGKIYHKQLDGCVSQ